MVYSCAYYTDWANDIAQAQRDKLEMICRKLRLKPGERFLDIGCGWGGLICHAAKNYGVTAHGITLSEEQLAFAREKIKRLGLEDQVTVELKDYSTMTGKFDKIASIGMYEHIGLKNIPGYMQKMRTLLARGRPVPQPRDFAPRAQAGLVQAAHAARAEGDRQVHLPRRRARRHRPLDLRHGAGRLRDPGRRGLAPALRAHLQAVVRAADGASARTAIDHVGEEKYRIWVAYLAGVSLAFSRGTLRIFQTLVSKSPSARRPCRRRAPTSTGKRWPPSAQRCHIRRPTAHA